MYSQLLVLQHDIPWTYPNLVFIVIKNGFTNTVAASHKSLITKLKELANSPSRLHSI